MSKWYNVLMSNFQIKIVILLVEYSYTYLVDM